MLPALQQCHCRGESRTAEAQACSHFKPRDRRRARSSGGNSRSRLRGLSAISVPWSGASKRMPPWQAKLESHKSPPAPSRSPFSCEFQIVRNCIYQTDSKTLRCGFLHKSHRACRTANFGANIDDGLLDECVNPACLFGSPQKLHRA